jgi:4-amino-4-deoxy-L-arabinose transferase-like glycosyltransferase
MDQVSKVQALEEDTRIVYGASKGCGVVCILLVVIPFLAEASGWMRNQSTLQVFIAAFYVNLFFTVLITTHLEYSLQPALDRAQNQLIVTLRQQIAEFSPQSESPINADVRDGKPHFEKRLTQMEIKVNRLEREAGLVNLTSWLIGIVALVMPCLVLLLLGSIEVPLKMARTIVILVWCMIFLCPVLVFIVYQYSYKPAIRRAKRGLIAQLQAQLAELQVLLNGN